MNVTMVTAGGIVYRFVHRVRLLEKALARAEALATAIGVDTGHGSALHLNEGCAWM
jgi:hypothetical protein